MLCPRCNRPLKSKKSIERGIGPICKKKQAYEEFLKNQMTIFEVLDDGNDHDTLQDCR
ncbi:DUF6011 domain-containing protein [Rummeliibacillus sp. TYF-LIM-RU47]|uniref:DUF6011 domain-containing protein n=1 Tax=Rummeliibacillus sp. TYF-LIM-RU47 TaxID=2608406 RepID=UPI001CC2697C|nr:DUF6011 domain-containing protein [Rummeliibacillus sp. TYF-LIM-RU47]